MLNKGMSAVENYLERCFHEVLEKINVVKEKEKLKAVVIFGSAVRPENFIIGLSDIDILTIISGEPKERYYCLKVCETEVNIMVVSTKELTRIFENGDPLAFILHKEGKILEGNGEVNSIITSKPRLTEHTLRVLRGSTFAALGLSLEHYFHENYREAISHAYHAIRHLARYGALKRSLEFPASDEEVMGTISNQTKNTFTELVFARKTYVGKEYCKEMVEKAMEAIALELKIKRPSLSFIENNLRGEAMAVIVNEAEGSMVIRIEAVNEEGIRRYEFDEKRIKEVEGLNEFLMKR